MLAGFTYTKAIHPLPIKLEFLMTFIEVVIE